MNADTLRIVTGVAVTILVSIPAFLYVSLTSKHFQVASGHYNSRRPTDPDYSRARGCIGFRHSPEWRDGYRTQCVGIPVGRWRCRATLPDDRGSWEVPCH
jgi:hypothetical protein